MPFPGDGRNTKPEWYVRVNEGDRETRLTAERAAPADAEALALAPDGLVLVARAVDVDLENRPIQVMRTRFSADRMELFFRH